jgi:hypothetical protein
MKLTETIDECLKLVVEEIEGTEYYISQYKDKNVPNQIKEWEQQLEVWKEHLSNLTFIKYETQLDEYDELIERDEK